jgi:hypothetical protein
MEILMSWQQDELIKRDQENELAAQIARDVETFRKSKEYGIKMLFDKFKEENDKLITGLKLNINDCTIIGKKDKLIRSKEKYLFHNDKKRINSGDSNDVYTVEINYNEEKNTYAVLDTTSGAWEIYRFKLEDAHIIVENLCTGAKLTKGLSLFS